MKYKVKLDIFEGPFDLLVYLIERSRMSIYDIQISEITTQYIEYVKKMQESDVELAQEFMVLAAELIQIKTKMLLPIEQSEQQGTEEAQDPRTQLVQKLLEYKQYKEMAAFLDEQAQAAAHIHEKPAEDLSVYTGETEEILKGSPAEFKQAFLAFLLKKQRIEEMHKVYERIERQKLSIEARMTQVSQVVDDRGNVMFSELLGNDTTNFNKVITFVSVLELLRERRISAQQQKQFGDISIRKAAFEND